MQVLALNSSPRAGGESKTGIMLEHLVAGMAAAGAQVEVVHLREKKINHCTGCFTCWTKTPGQCIHQDDMARELFPRWLAADIVVYASPLYYHTMNAVMATFIERTLPAAQPFFEVNDAGITYHPLRNRVPAVVNLCVCGFPDMEEFDAFLDFSKKTRHADVKHIVDIMRPAAEMLLNPFLRGVRKSILEATEQAGREIVTTMRVQPETLARIQQPLVDKGFFREMGNLYWKTCIAEGVSPITFGRKKMVPRPETLHDFMTIFPLGLNTNAVGDRQATLQFNFSGTVQDACHFVIEQKRVAARPGSAGNPDITIDTPFALWMDVMTRKADGQQMFLEGKYRVAGDFELMLQLFRGEES